MKPIKCQGQSKGRATQTSNLQKLTSFFRELISVSKLSIFLSYWLIRPCSPSSSSDVRSANRWADWEGSSSASGSSGVISRQCVGPLVQITVSVIQHMCLDKSFTMLKENQCSGRDLCIIFLADTLPPICMKRPVWRPFPVVSTVLEFWP